MRCPPRSSINNWISLYYGINNTEQGSGSVDRVVTSDNRGPRFKSSHQQHFKQTMCFLLTVEKTIFLKRPGMASLKTIQSKVQITVATITDKIEKNKTSQYRTNIVSHIIFGRYLKRSKQPHFLTSNLFKGLYFTPIMGDAPHK